MTLLSRVLLTFAGSACLALAQKTADPVPSDWLRDGKLTVPQFEFSLQSPGPDSRWTHQVLPDIQGSKATAFIAEVSSEEKFLMVVWEKSGQIGPESTKQFVDGFQRSLPADWKVQGAVIDPSTVPTKDSMKFKATLALPNDVILYAYGYMVSSVGRTFMFYDYSQETAEPAKFTRFVSSFALVQAPSSVASDVGFYALFIGIALVGQGIPIWLATKAKPLGGKPYRWATYVGVITGFIGAGFSPLIFTASDVYGKEAAAVLSISAIACSVGILRRQKFGVIMFVLTYLFVMMASPFMDAMRNVPPNPQQAGQGGFVLIFLGLTIGYFVKRWSLLGKTSAVQPPAFPA